MIVVNFLFNLRLFFFAHNESVFKSAWLDDCLIDVYNKQKRHTEEQSNS